jgi:hypothetical protein
MAKGQKRSTRETKKPKATAKVEKAAPASVFLQETNRKTTAATRDKG